MRRCWTTAVTVSAILGIVVCISGILLHIYGPLIIKSVIASRKELSPDTEAYLLWKNIPFPTYREFHIFNITNLDEYLEGIGSGVKPRLEELGPYVFRQTETKENITWDDDEDSITYRLRIFYTYVPEKSNGSLDDIIVMPNIPLITVAATSEEVDLMLMDLLMNSSGTTLFINGTFRTLFFEGYKDPFIDLIQTVSGKEMLKGARFSLLTNGSDEGVHKVNRGRKDPKQYGAVMEWNGKPNLEWWSGEHCNMINGTDGRLIEAGLKKHSHFYTFGAEVCRSLIMHYFSENPVKGINAYRYKPRVESWGDFNINPENKCFCAPAGNCFEAGVINLASCKQNAPILLSLPHFLFASYHYEQAVEGMSPNEEEHDSYLDVEPITGLTLHGSRKTQLNVLMESRAGLRIFENITRILFPFVWIKEHAMVTDEFAEMLRSQLGLTEALEETIPYTLIGIGGGILVIAVFIAFVLLCRLTSSFRSFDTNSETKTYLK